MSEAPNHTAEARPHQVPAESAGSGKHRGRASHEESSTAARGRHRRPDNRAS